MKAIIYEAKKNLRKLRKERDLWYQKFVKNEKIRYDRDDKLTEAIQESDRLYSEYKDLAIRINNLEKELRNHRRTKIKL